MLKIRFGNEKKVPVFEGMSEEQFAHVFYLGRGDGVEADSIIIVDEKGKHVGFLADDWRDIIWDLPIHCARDIGQYKTRLIRVADIKDGKWGVYVLPRNVLDWSYSWVDRLKEHDMKNMHMEKDGFIFFCGNEIPVPLFLRSFLALPFWKKAVLIEKILKSNDKKDVASLAGDVMKASGLLNEEINQVMDSDEPAYEFLDMLGVSWPDMKEDMKLPFFEDKK